MATKTGELRETLIEAIAQVQSGKMDPDKAKAIALLAGQINSSLQVEINVIKEARALGIFQSQLKGVTEFGALSVGEALLPIKSAA